jgi:L-amino acid N-acyltransferase YncA
VAMDIRLGPIAAGDGRAIVDLFNYYVTHSFAAFPEEPLPYPFFERLMEATRNLPNVAAKDAEGRLIGFALLRPHDPWTTSSHVAEISYFIAPEATGQGIGSKMLAELETRAKARGIRTLLAAISSLNDASLSFHRKHGFAEVGRLRNVHIKHGTPFDTVWMQKEI